MLEYYVTHKTPDWGEQFKLACMLGPQIDEDDHITEVSSSECAIHLLAMPWKILTAMMPPRCYWNGWLSFLVGLIFIGALSAVVGQTSELLGCVYSIKNSTIAITIIAIGNSLPDSYATKLAAENSKYADAAIGNVTASNAVNVFLGMGISWLIGSIYSKVVLNIDYEVQTSSITFSITLFLICSAIAFTVLGVRRCCIGGELGGRGMQRGFSAILLFILWLVYIVGCSLQQYGYLDIRI